jgi:hypothetical protein
VQFPAGAVPCRRRFLALYAGLAAAATAAVAGAAVQLAGAGQQPGPNQVIRRFIATAVQQDHPERGWGLVTRDLRAGQTRAEWAAGTSTIVPFPYRHVDVVLKLVKHGAGYEQVFVKLRSTGDSASFLVEVRREQGRWLVSYWGPAMLIVPGA